jgi:hypothetical protein
LASVPLYGGREEVASEPQEGRRRDGKLSDVQDGSLMLTTYTLAPKVHVVNIRNEAASLIDAPQDCNSTAQDISGEPAARSAWSDALTQHVSLPSQPREHDRRQCPTRPAMDEFLEWNSRDRPTEQLLGVPNALENARNKRFVQKADRAVDDRDEQPAGPRSRPQAQPQ